MTIVTITALAAIALGTYGALSKRDLLRVFIGVTIMLSGTSLLLVSMARTPEQASLAYSFVIFIWVVEIMEVIVALALFLVLGKRGKHALSSWGEFKW